MAAASDIGITEIVCNIYSSEQIRENFTRSIFIGLQMNVDYGLFTSFFIGPNKFKVENY